MQALFTRSLKLTALLLTVLFMNLSCKKEKEILEVLPILEALPITQDRETPPPHPTTFINNYRVLVKEKGNVTVVEYGILFSTYYTGEIINNSPYLFKEPTFQTHGRHIITEEFGVGEKVMRRKGNYPLRTHVYQRAYAKLEDGRIIHSDIVFTTHEKIATPF